MQTSIIQYAAKAVWAALVPVITALSAWLLGKGIDVSWLTEEWFVATVTSVATSVVVYFKRNKPKFL